MIATEIDVLTFDAEKHHYFFKGVRVPNVTSLLQDYGLIDLSGIPEDRLEYKRVLGTAVDIACHLINEHDLNESSLSPAIVPYVEAYKKFAGMTGFEPKHSKARLYSKVWRFAGEFDCAGPLHWKGRDYRCAIVDNKCTWAMYPSVGPQIAAYQILFEENFRPEKVDGRFGLQLKNNGTFELFQYTTPADRQVFLSALTLHHWRQDKGLLKKENV